MWNATFCDVLHETKQKSKQTLESAQYGLEIIFNVEGRPNHRNKAVFSNFSGVMWTGLKQTIREWSYWIFYCVGERCNFFLLAVIN